MTTDWNDDVNVQNCYWADKIKETRNDGQYDSVVFGKYYDILDKLRPDYQKQFGLDNQTTQNMNFGNSGGYADVIDCQKFEKIT